MRLSAAILGVWLLLVGQATAQVPRTRGETLNQKPLVVADSIKGKPALLIVTFSKNAGESAAVWTKALRAKGIPAKCAIYQIAQLEGVPRLFRRLVISSMRKGVPAERHDAFLVLTTETQLWKKFVGFTRDDDPYLVLVDETGAIRRRISGEFNEERQKEIAENLQ